MTTKTDYETLLEQLAETKTAAENIEMGIRTLPAEFRDKAQANLSLLSSMQTLVRNFARLEAERVASLHRIALSQMDARGHA